MKKIKAFNNNLLKVAGLVLIVSLSSCLKNGNYYTDFSAVNGSVDLPLAAANSNGVITFAYDATVTTTSIPVYVNLASPGTLGKAVTATLALDTAFLNQYNAANSTAFVVMPDSIFSVTSWNRTIPAGKRLDSMVVTFNFAKMDLSQPYVFPVTIASSSEPIEQWNHLLLNVAVKNKYDGKYSMTIKLTGWGSYGISDGPQYSWPSKVGFVTTGANSGNIVTNEVGASQGGFTSAGALTGFGAAVPNYIFNSSNICTSIVNESPDSRNRAFAPDPASSSYFDPKTHNIYLNYIMTQTGRTPQYISDTLTYVGSR